MSRRLAIGLALLLAGWTATAAERRPERRGLAERLDPLRLRTRYHDARLQRNLGWGLAGAGTALLGVGMVLVGFALVDETQSYSAHLGEAAAGAATALVGLALAIPGIVLALRAQSTMTDARWRIDTFLSPLAGGAGVGLRARF